MKCNICTNLNLSNISEHTTSSEHRSGVCALGVLCQQPVKQCLFLSILSIY